jgi:hypothetical protein
MSLGVKQNEPNTAVVIENDIIKYTVAGIVGKKDIHRFVNIGDRALDENIIHLVLIDINKVDRFSLEDRAYLVRFLKNPHIKKIAIFGGNRFIRTVVSFIVTATNVRLFTAEEEALDWLSAQSP